MFRNRRPPARAKSPPGHSGAAGSPGNRRNGVWGRVAAVCLTGCLLAGAVRGAEKGGTLFFQPSLLKDRAQRYAAWSHSITVRDGKFYNAVSVQKFTDAAVPAGPMGLAIAESADGVHWREIESFACPLENGLAGYCWRHNGREFVYYVTERDTRADPAGHPLMVRQYRSKDLKKWEFMGEAFTTRPDPRWYRCRWDELAMLEDGGIFYGYITSEPRPELAKDSLGMLKSKDGIRWEVLPPPVFEWDGLPPQQMELCFAEKLNGRYYLGMGSRAYLDHRGFSVVTFVGHTPTGPFRPDKEAFRLCGNTVRDTNWLAKTVHWKGEILLSNWITTHLDKSFPGIFANGQSLWVGPLKKLVADKAGHLRIAWWPGNEAAGGAALSVKLRDAVLAHPAKKYQGQLFKIGAAGADSLSLRGGHDGAVALLPGTFDFKRGFLIEGTLKATEPRGPMVGTHWHPAAAGFYFEDAPGRGMLLQLETLGLTRIGTFEYAPEPRFDADEFALASYGNTKRGGGPYLGLSRFTPEDVVGPMGYAPPCGIQNGTAHRFRLLVKNGIFEFYLDDLLVQTYLTGTTNGRLGLFAKSGPVEFSGLRFRAMTDGVPAPRP